MNHKMLLIVPLVLIALAVGMTAAGADPAGPMPASPRQALSVGASRSGAAPLTPVGSGFTYQGSLKSGGSPANGQYDFQFTLYDALTGGNLVSGPVTTANVTVTGGLFTVTLDFGVDAFTGEARYLEIAVRQTGGGAYTTLTPRQPLTPTPYALSLMPGAVIRGTTGPGVAILGTVNSGSGYGMYGESTASDGTGLRGVANTGPNAAGVYGTSASNYGVWGESTANDGTGLRGVANNGFDAKGVYGSSDSGTGLYGTSIDGFGVHGSSNNHLGVAGISINDIGVYGQSAYFHAIYGESANSGDGVHGVSLDNGKGVYGLSNNNEGVHGETGSNFAGVQGINTSSGGIGPGVRGDSTTGPGVYGYSPNNKGVWGQSTSNDGLFGTSSSSSGVAGISTSGNGVYGFSTSGPYAGYFQGNVRITGTCCSMGAGTTQIDHPQDPANKYLNQSTVESPDMKTIYDGIATLDATGEAWVEMPSYSQSLNQDFRYQLTPIGAPGRDLYIAQEIENNRFKIAGGKAGMRVSWQVTGIRHDPYAIQHPVSVEQNKPANEKGKYLHPAEYGKPETLGIGYEQSQNAKQQLPPTEPGR